MGGLDLNKKLWRVPQRHGKGVCAGIAQYLDVPVKLVRLITVLAMIFGLFFFVVVAYIILTFALDRCRKVNCTARKCRPAVSCWPRRIKLAASERRLREMERYVTSDTFTLRSRFRQL
jgi:phage shock protein C